MDLPRASSTRRASFDARAPRRAAHDHAVQFYEREDFLFDVVSRFLGEGLDAGAPLVVVAREENEGGFTAALRRRGHDVEGARERGQLVLVGARELLSRFMVGSLPDRARFEVAVGGVLARAAGRGPARARAYGEMVDVLWCEGHSQAALLLEELWNELAERHGLSLLCAYAMGSFYSEAHARPFERICSAHSHVLPTERYADAEADARAREITLLQQRALALETEVAHRRGLEDALRRALEDLRASEHALREVDRRKDEFLAMLGHELRNPLAPILTSLQLMRLRGGGSREQDLIERQVRHLVRLVDDLLDVSRVTRGKVPLAKEPLELAGVLARAIELAMPLLEQRSHVLAVDVPEEGMLVHADMVRLAQVFSNLLANAAKYTDPHGRVTVSARREGGDVVVSVKDSGVGIPPEMLGSVFDLFVQGERSLDRSQGGLGIGLTVARGLVELHGGTIAAFSAGEGTGSEVVVRLPALAGASPSPGDGAVVEARHVPGALRILVVDDNADAADVLADALRALGHEVAVAHDGPEALALVPSFAPDAAVLDIGLPGMDGYELARRLRAESPAHPPRLVALTGYGQDGDRAKAREAGFDVHLVKPVDLGAVMTLFAAP